MANLLHLSAKLFLPNYINIESNSYHAQLGGAPFPYLLYFSLLILFDNLIR